MVSSLRHIVFSNHDRGNPDTLVFFFREELSFRNLAVRKLWHYGDVIMDAIAFQIRSKKTPKRRVTGLCAGNSSGTGEFPAQMASNAENVSIRWRHHVMFGNSIAHWPTNRKRTNRHKYFQMQFRNLTSQQEIYFVRNAHMVVSDCPINNNATGQVIVWCLPGGKTLQNPWWWSLLTTYASPCFSALRNNINSKLPTWSSYQTFNSIPSHQIISHTLLVKRSEFSGITRSISWLLITLTS